MRSSQSHDVYLNASNIQDDYCTIAGTWREPHPDVLTSPALAQLKADMLPHPRHCLLVSVSHIC
jgi:hypothetical protein